MMQLITLSYTEGIYKSKHNSCTAKEHRGVLVTHDQTCQAEG